ncbi:MAG: glycosyltransferase [Prevotellaceae bacterium]|jgi:glycosyltransferase involved in cell wall biosynthesis|nr:glycosyltransferase [Prevotellaceae bacterium]
MKPIIDLILPCYNPLPDWKETVHTYFDRLQTLLPDVELRLTIANDGSERHVDAEAQQQLRRYIPTAQIAGYEKNRGKGYTLRHAVRQCTAPYIIYTDYDFPFELESIKSVAVALLNHADVVVGNRSSSYYKQLPMKRKIMSKVSRCLNKYLLRIPACDTQGGLKGFNRKGREVFLQTKIEQFLFDTEFVFKACRRKDLTLQVVPIHTREGVIFSNMGAKVLRKELKNFLRILFRCV